MISVQTRSIEAARHERAISAIAEAGNASLEKIRRLFAEEFARLEKGAKVRTYLHALAVANVRAHVREAATLVDDANAPWHGARLVPIWEV